MSALPPLLSGFFGTMGLAFIIGLELHAYRRRGEGALEPQAQGFGTTRTITLIAALGFALWVIAPVTPFCVGLGVLGLALMLDYRKRVKPGDTSLVPSDDRADLLYAGAADAYRAPGGDRGADRADPAGIGRAGEDPPLLRRLPDRGRRDAGEIPDPGRADLSRCCRRPSCLICPASPGRRSGWRCW